MSGDEVGRLLRALGRGDWRALLVPGAEELLVLALLVDPATGAARAHTIALEIALEASGRRRHLRFRDIPQAQSYYKARSWDGTEDHAAILPIALRMVHHLTKRRPEDADRRRALAILERLAPR